MTAVLSNAGLLRLIVQFQHGVYEDLLPWRKEAAAMDTAWHPSVQGLMYTHLPQRFLHLPYTSEHVLFLPQAVLLPARHLNLSSTERDPRLPLHIAIIDGDTRRIGRWLDCYPQWASPQALDLAAQVGHLDVVVYLHTHRVDCTTNAMDYAAGNGHLSIVRFLAEHRKEGCTENAMYDAAMYGHLPVVEYLYAAGLARCSSIALMHATWHQHNAVAAFIHAHCDDPIPPPL
ncbi:hypothetical protein SDRG_08642 [Saprolegnia diclina VS20]|uniref:Uncharacterized protein n=1 Tax=Saprolegnia diclina (strain VS20) TaxID=1156394 RepID=T0RNN7_SAPDV|nr:hypothetical protein SDRG_08642 [Saprolegnia diclina VS20]EQC33963.1 hypothetical protein SDRG_08642 [Saprolegnia diclina VS20]|eukprot:XP_008612758.1 hypothetical protein SDRG_08642 [Saprolegnia diclina VS20]